MTVATPMTIPRTVSPERIRFAATARTPNRAFSMDERIPELRHVDLDAYRKPGTRFARITLTA